MPSVKLEDMIKDICPDARIKIVGRRRGEKIEEDLITEDEKLTVSKEFDRIVIRGWRP
jgi:FlaA1/EpsC-like NDP-sugar epimerase